MTIMESLSVQELTDLACIRYGQLITPIDVYLLNEERREALLKDVVEEYTQYIPMTKILHVNGSSGGTFLGKDIISVRNVRMDNFYFSKLSPRMNRRQRRFDPHTKMLHTPLDMPLVVECGAYYPVGRIPIANQVDTVLAGDTYVNFKLRNFRHGSLKIEIGEYAWNDTGVDYDNPTSIDDITKEVEKVRDSLNSTNIRNACESIVSITPQDDDNLHLADGSILTYTTDINKRFIDIMTEKYGEGSSHPSYFVTEEVWQETINNFKVCDKFVYNPTTKTLRLPKWGRQIMLPQDTLDLNAMVVMGLYYYLVIGSVDTSSLQEDLDQVVAELKELDLTTPKDLVVLNPSNIKSSVATAIYDVKSEMLKISSLEKLELSGEYAVVASYNTNSPVVQGLSLRDKLFVDLFIGRLMLALGNAKIQVTMEGDLTNFAGDDLITQGQALVDKTLELLMSSSTTYKVL